MSPCTERNLFQIPTCQVGFFACRALKCLFCLGHEKDRHLHRWFSTICPPLRGCNIFSAWISMFSHQVAKSELQTYVYSVFVSHLSIIPGCHPKALCHNPYYLLSGFLLKSRLYFPLQSYLFSVFNSFSTAAEDCPEYKVTDSKIIHKSINI